MNAGDKIPVQTQLADYNDAQYPLATVTDADGTEISGSPFPLTPVDSTGFYNNIDAIMPDSPWVSVVIKTYQDSGHTSLSDSEGGTDYNVYLTGSSSGGSLPTSSAITGLIETDTCEPGPIQDTVIKGSDRTLTVRLVQDIDGNPFNLNGASLIEFRFRNADGTILSLKSTGVGNPVQIVSAAGGKLLCILTAAQTLLLASLIPSPFTIKVTQSAGLTLANLPTQLAVVEQDA